MIRLRAISIIAALLVVAALFTVAALLSYQKFREELVDRQLLDHQRLGQVITQSLTQYFRRVQQVTEFAAYNEAFDPEKSEGEDKLRYRALDGAKAEVLRQSLAIQGVLRDRDLASSPQKPGPLLTWQLFKGLPDRNELGEPVAVERRRIAHQAMQAFPELEFVFEIDPTGDIVFVEPFSAQKNLSSFNYSFRDYLVGSKSTRSTTLSEAYISLDEHKTQAIALASPVFDRSGEIAKIVGASVSNATLRRIVFQPLKEGLAPQDSSVFYLVDRHGHVVASSSDGGDYEPRPHATTDEEDRGNFRSYGPMNLLQWEDDDFEQGTDWHRKTKSWIVSSLRTYYSKEYHNGDTQVFGTFYPVFVIDRRPQHYGILIETPIQAIHHSQNQLNIIFVSAGLLLLVILFLFGRSIWASYVNTTKALANKELQLQQLAAQVSYDVRSPLAGLQMLLPSLEDQPEPVRIMFRNTVNQINDIANDLVRSKR
jgi:hypothetical protein